MSDETTIKKKLNLGIEAARSGQKNIAQVHLSAVLQLDPNNVPALFWLAYVSPSPQDSISLLERVLELEPDNERAQSGLRWATSRLGLGSDRPAQPAHRRSATGPGTDPRGQPLRRPAAGALPPKRSPTGAALAGRRPALWRCLAPNNTRLLSLTIS